MRSDTSRACLPRRSDFGSLRRGSDDPGESRRRKDEVYVPQCKERDRDLSRSWGFTANDTLDANYGVAGFSSAGVLTGGSAGLSPSGFFSSSALGSSG